MSGIKKETKNVRKNKHTLFLFALLAFSSVSASAQLSLGYYQFKDGSEYTGELKGRRPNGKGKTVFRNGDVYEGEYVKGKRQGEGTYTFSDGEKYVGEWFDDQQHGKGT